MLHQTLPAPIETYPSEHPEIAWKDGRIVPWADCTLHVRMQAGFFGANIFEGLRAYWNADEERMYVFRLDDHLVRLEQSMRIMRMTPPFSRHELGDAVLELFQRTDFRGHGQANLVTYFGFPPPGDPVSHAAPSGAHITAVPMGRSPAAKTGLTAGVSSWRRLSDDTMPIRVKIGSNYQNSRLAQNEVRAGGYDMALLLNRAGKLAEAPGACLFILRDGVLITPPTNADILESITRDTVLTFARQELGLTVIEREVDRSEAYIADEVFICGSIAEILPLTSIDGIEIGDGQPGAVTRDLQELYFQTVEARLPRYAAWCTAVPAPAG
ncbi:branched-chain-amino-acid transaminase [Thalassococcus sp. S3]|uniref:branched-chain-amino-acid transaminase n=1 Tax=Thalassococcus sp. S3 TaxID=2017482 RepID=UPI0013EE93B1|nr:branched-chain-amino-acid transaminase [Thalassococcus sp. S3]